MEYWNKLLENQYVSQAVNGEYDSTAVALAVGGVLATLYVGLTLFGPSPKNTNSKPQRVKVKKEKVIPKDPVKEAHKTIKYVLEELKDTITPEIEKLEADVATEQNGGKLENDSYKNKTKYRYLFLNETILKMLIRLDGVDPHTFGDNVSEEIKSEIRDKRKTAVKAVNLQDKRLQKLKDSVR